MKAVIRHTYNTAAEHFRVALKFSIILSLSFVIIYLGARIAGLYKMTELRFINYILFYPVGFAAVRKVYMENDHYIDYFSGLMIGFLTGALGQFWFALLFFIYLNFDAPFMSYLITQLPQPLFYPHLSVLFIMISEGLAMSAILSLTLMQYFKWRQGRWVVHHG